MCMAHAAKKTIKHRIFFRLRDVVEMAASIMVPYIVYCHTASGVVYHCFCVCQLYKHLDTEQLLCLACIYICPFLGGNPLDLQLTTGSLSSFSFFIQLFKTLLLMLREVSQLSSNNHQESSSETTY